MVGSSNNQLKFTFHLCFFPPSFFKYIFSTVALGVELSAFHCIEIIITWDDSSCANDWAGKPLAWNEPQRKLATAMTRTPRRRTDVKRRRSTRVKNMPRNYFRSTWQQQWDGSRLVRSFQKCLFRNMNEGYKNSAMPRKNALWAFQCCHISHHKIFMFEESF